MAVFLLVNAKNVTILNETEGVANAILKNPTKDAPTGLKIAHTFGLKGYKELLNASQNKGLPTNFLIVEKSIKIFLKNLVV